MEEDARLSRLQAQLERLPSADAPELRFPRSPAELELEPPPADLDRGPEPDPEPGPELDPDPAASTAVSEPDRLATVVPHPWASSGTWAASGEEDRGWHGIGPVLYGIIIAAILVGEFPLNAVAFRLFGESDLFTYVMTASLAISLVAIAHFLGAVLAGRMGSRVARIAVGAVSAALVAAIGVISLIRYDYLRRVGGELVGPVAGTLAFAFINLVVFAAAVGCSYLRHDPRTLVNRRAEARRAEREADRAERRRAERERKQEQERRAREEERRRRELEAERERRRHELELEAERRRAELEARRDAAMLRREQLLEAMETIREAGRERLRALEELERAVEAARSALAELEGQARALRGRREALRDAAEARLRVVRAHRDRLVAAYCSANVRARKDRTAPRCFEAIPPLAGLPDRVGEVA